MPTLQELLGYSLVPQLQNKNRMNPLAVDTQGEEPVARAIAQAPQPSQPTIQPPQAAPAPRIDPMQAILKDIQAAELKRQAAIAPLIEKQKQDNEMKRNTLKAYLEKTSPKLDLSPLAALVDSSTGSKFAGDYKSPVGPNDLIDNVTKQQAGISASDKDIAEAQAKNHSDALAGKILLAQARAGQQQGMLDDKFAFRAHKSVVDNIKNDPQLKAQLVQLRNLDNAATLVNKSETLTPQQIDEFQQAVRANLGIKGTSGVGEREKNYFNTLGLNGERLAQFLTGDPANIAKDAPLVKHIKDLANVESKNVKGQLADRLDVLTEGYGSIYDTHPKLKSDLDRLVDSFSKQTTTRAPGESSASGGKTARQLEIEQLKKELGE